MDFSVDAFFEMSISEQREFLELCKIRFRKLENINEKLKAEVTKLENALKDVGQKNLNPDREELLQEKLRFYRNELDKYVERNKALELEIESLQGAKRELEFEIERLNILGNSWEVNLTKLRELRNQDTPKGRKVSTDSYEIRQAVEEKAKEELQKAEQMLEVREEPEKNPEEKIIQQENVIEELIAENSRLLIQNYQLKYQVERII